MDKASRDQFADWVVAEILKAKARWIHECFRAVLPEDLYKLAAKDEQLDRVRAWCKANDYAWFEGKDAAGNGESLFKKGPLIVGTFKPRLEPKEGGGKQIAFHATVLNRPVMVV